VGKRGPRCSVCAHQERRQIDLGLARGVSVTALSRQFSLSRDTLYRHLRLGHLPAQERAALVAGPDMGGLSLEQLQAREGASLLAHLVAIRNRLLNAMDLGERFADVALVTKATAQLHENLALTGRLVGQLATGSTTINNFLIQPEYVDFRTKLLKALAPFPEARVAVAAVLNSTEHDESAKLIEHQPIEHES
jgi:lambda repressor-like predicted transcriptional regulator